MSKKELTLDEITVIAHQIKSIARLTNFSSQLVLEELEGIVVSEEDAGRIKRAMQRMAA